MNSRIRHLGLVVAIGLIATACGSNKPGGSGASGAPTAAGSQAPAVSPSAITGTLNVWAMGNEGVELGALATGFMAANPGVTVKVTPVDWGQAVAKLQTAIGGHQTPDVSQMGTDMMGQFAETGALEAVPANFDPKTYFESAWNTGVVKGTAYGVPWYVETRVLYYRKDIAEEAGITKPPTTWDELKAMAKAMKGKGSAKWGISLGTKNEQEYLPFVWSNGGKVIGDDGKFALDSPQAVEVLKFYAAFFDEGLSPKSVPEGFDITPAFVAGTHPMFFSGPWHLGLIDKAGGASFKDKWAIAPMPKKASATSFLGGANMVVYKDSKNKDAAWAFVQYVTDPKTQVKWYQQVTDLPAVQAAWQDPVVSGDANVKVFGEQLKDAQGPPAIPTWNEVKAAINDQLEKVTTGGTSPEAGAKAMNDAANSIGTGN